MTDLTSIANQSAAAEPGSRESYELDARACDYRLLNDPNLSDEDRNDLIRHLRDDAAHNAQGAIAHAAMALGKAKNLTPAQHRELISILEASVEAHPKATFFSARDILGYALTCKKKHLQPEEIALLTAVRDRAFALCKDWEGETPKLSEAPIISAP